MGPSPIRVEEPIRDMPGIPYPEPKEMTIEDIEETKKEYEQSVKYAL